MMELATLGIGENAGKVWQALEETQELTIAQLIQKLDLPDYSIYAAIGWLAREGKIFYRHADDEIVVSNKSDVRNYEFG